MMLTGLHLLGLILPLSTTAAHGRQEAVVETQEKAKGEAPPDPSLFIYELGSEKAQMVVVSKLLIKWLV